MSPDPTDVVGPASGLDQLSTDALRRRRGDLCAAAQFQAMHGLPVDGNGDDARTLAAIDAELRRRGESPHHG